MALYDTMKNLIAGATLFADTPLGTINAFGGNTAPNGWLMCQGQALSRTEYADLFAVIGTNFGSGDGSTTFNLPDMREATTKGAGLTSKSSNHMDADGLALGEFLDDRVQEHNHYVHNGTASVWESNVDGGSSPTASDLRSAGPTSDNPRLIAKDISYGRHGATTEVKAVGVNYIMKVKQTPVPADVLTKLEELLADKDYLTFSGS